MSQRVIFKTMDSPKVSFQRRRRYHKGKEAAEFDESNHRDSFRPVAQDKGKRIRQRILYQKGGVEASEGSDVASTPNKNLRNQEPL